jgi:hypothetical protein
MHRLTESLPGSILTLFSAVFYIDEASESFLSGFFIFKFPTKILNPLRKMEKPYSVHPEIVIHTRKIPNAQSAPMMNNE